MVTRPAAILLLFLALSLGVFPALAAALEECTDCLTEASPGDCLATCPLCSCGLARSESALGPAEACPLTVAGRLDASAPRCAVLGIGHDVFHVPRTA